MDIFSILNKFKPFTDEEIYFHNECHTANPAEINERRIITQLYFIKTMEQLTEKTIQANNKLAESNDKHSRRMALLTAAIAFAAIVSLAISIF